MVKKIICFLIIICLCLGFSGCPYTPARFLGQEVGLYSVAMNSVLGCSYHGDIKVLEEDSFGRVLFSGSSTLNYFSILICQKEDKQNGYVYFYPDCNFIVAKNADDITEDQIDLLKQQNNWDEELNENLMTKVKILRKQEKMSSDITKRKIKKILKEDPSYVWHAGFRLELVTKDAKGKHLFYVRTTPGFDRNYVVIINANGTYDKDNCIMEIIDLWNYQDDLKEFKAHNDWQKV